MQVLLLENYRTGYGKTGMCLCESSAKSMKLLSFIYLLYGAGNVDYVSELSEEAPCSRYDDNNERSE